MRTVHVEGNGTVSIAEVPDPVPGPGEVVVETAVTALCGSELSTYRGPGMEMGNSGHEAAGIVAVQTSESRSNDPIVRLPISPLRKPVQAAI